MKNVKFFAMFALVLGAMVFTTGCVSPVSGSSSMTGASDSAVQLAVYGTTTLIDVKVDEAGTEGYGNVIPYFDSGTLKYMTDIGTNNTATLAAVVNSGTAITTGNAISYGYNQAVYFAYLPSGQTNWASAKVAVYEVKNNVSYFTKYNVKVTSKSDPNAYVNSLTFMRYGNTYYGKVPVSSSVRVAFNDYNTNDGDYPTSTTGTVFTSSVDIQGYKYMLVTYWPRGADTTDPTTAQHGYVEINGNSVIPNAKSTSSGVGYSSGQSVALNVGDKVTFFTPASGVSELYYYVSQTGIEPSDKTSIFSGKQNTTDSNGNLSIDVTYSGYIVYLFAWTKSSSGTYSSFFKMTITPGTGISSVATVQSVSLPATMTVQVGGSGTLTATYNPSNASNQATNWSVSGTAATISSGTSTMVTITPVSAGTVTVTATAQDQTNGVKTASCLVTVIAAGTTTTTTTTTTTSVNLKIDSSWAGKTMEITFPVNGSWTNATKKTGVVASDGRIPVVINVGQEFSITCSSTWTDLKGLSGVSDWQAPGWTTTNGYLDIQVGSNAAVTVRVPIVSAQ